MTRSKIILAALAAATGIAVVVGRRAASARKARSSEPSDHASEHAHLSKRDKRIAARHARRQKRHAREQPVN